MRVVVEGVGARRWVWLFKESSLRCGRPIRESAWAGLLVARNGGLLGVVSLWDGCGLSPPQIPGPGEVSGN